MIERLGPESQGILEGLSANAITSVEVLEPGETIPSGSTITKPQDDDNPPPSGGGGSGSGTTFNPSITASAATINVGASVTFTLGGTFTGTQDVAADWDFNYNNQDLNATTSGNSVVHTFYGPGVYTVAADVTDDEGDEQIVTQTVTVIDVATLVVIPPPDQEVDENQAVTFSAPQTLDLVGQVQSSSIQWDFNYNGTFQASSGSSYTYTTPGNYVAAVQVSDNQGLTQVGLVNVVVDPVGPDVCAGSDMTVNAGQTVTFSGTATDNSGTGLATIAWDFDYDGETFVADAAANGTLTPTYTYDDPGTYDVALDVTDNQGNENMDVITVTVNDVAPTGTITLAATQPNGTAQNLSSGNPVYFAVSNLDYTDPSVTPSIWADWNGDGDFNLVTEDQWQDLSTAANGADSLILSYTYDAPGTYTPAFRFEDAEGDFTPQTLSVTITDPGPSGTFGWAGSPHTIQSTDTVSFTNVTDPSQTETEDGFTYYYQIDNGGYQASDAPDFTLEGLNPGTSHTIQAYIENAAGDQSPVYTQVVNVQNDLDIVNDGSGTALMQWTNSDGSSGNATLAGGGQIYTFPDAISGLNITLQTSGASYDLCTNGSIDSINGAGVSGVTLQVHTDEDESMPDPVGDGHVGPIQLGPSSSLTSHLPRAAFGGLTGPGDTQVVSLDVGNLTGPISGVYHIGTLQSSGNASNVTVSDGIDDLEAYALGSITFETDPNGPATASQVVVGPGGQMGSLVFGNQLVTVTQMDANDNVTSITDPSGHITTISYDSNNDPLTLTDSQGTYTFQYGSGQNQEQMVRLAPPGAPPATQTASITMHPDGWWSNACNWVSESVSAAVDTATTFVQDAANATGQVINNALTTIQVAGQNIAARVSDTWTAGVTSVTWLVDQTGNQMLAIGNQLVQATKAVAEGFVQQLESFGKAFTDLWTQLQQFGAAANQVLAAVIANPGTFLSNLASGVGQGLENFFNNLSTTLPNQLWQWLTQGLNIPNLSQFDFTTTAGVGQFLLTFFNLTWSNVQSMLVNMVGAGNVALVTQAYNYISTWVNQGLSGVWNMLQDAGQTLTVGSLVTSAVNAGVNYIVTKVVPDAVAFIAAKFAVPAAGIISTIYDTVTWLYNSINQVTQLASLATTIANQIAGVAQGSATAISQLSTQVTSFLNGLIPVGINFLASQLHINDLPQAVGNVVAQVQAAPTKAIQAALNWLKAKALSLLGFGNGTQAPDGLIGLVLTFNVGDAQHRIWVVNQNGQAVIMRASTAAPVNLSTDLPSGLAASALAQVKGDYSQVLQYANQIIQSANAASQPGGSGSLGQMPQQTASMQQALVNLQTDMVNDGACCFLVPVLKRGHIC